MWVLAVLSTVAATHIAALLAGHPATPEAERIAMTAGYARGFLIASIVALAAGMLALIIPRQVSSTAPLAAQASASPDTPAVPLVES
jgi:hydrogenase/urease accessory protein HupE